ncbi:hypothetical protein COO58_17525 [Micromonospora sp. WMMA1996]|nr:hypothetical protein COO58_17525 [Micromonospora sp. WMMA1996]
MADQQEADRQLRDDLARLADAAEAARTGDSGPLAALNAEQNGDDLLDVADATGVTPLPDVDGALLVDEVQAWLAGRDGDR